MKTEEGLKRLPSFSYFFVRVTVYHTYMTNVIYLDLTDRNKPNLTQADFIPKMI